MIELNRIYNEPCEETMKRLPDGCIDLVLTSPPYDKIRDYKGFAFDIEAIVPELYRIIKPGGVVVWVIGDQTVKGSETLSSFRQAIRFQDQGFLVHDTMIYEKSPSYPANDESNRYSQTFEYMFIFSKGVPKTANLIKDRKNKWGGSHSFGVQRERLKNGEMKERNKIAVQEYGYRFNIWNYPTGKGFSATDLIAYKHPAIFPESLARDHIYTWSNKGDVVYDPFMGSGTTAKMALILERKYVGSEISAEYCEIARKRLNKLLVA